MKFGSPLGSKTRIYIYLTCRTKPRREKANVYRKGARVSRTKKNLIRGELVEPDGGDGVALQALCQSGLCCARVIAGSYRTTECVSCVHLFRATTQDQPKSYLDRLDFPSLLPRELMKHIMIPVRSSQPDEPLYGQGKNIFLIKLGA